MIDEVIEGYGQAIKKAIIDYVLLDPGERDRLGVYIRYRNVPLYGDVRPGVINVKNTNSLYARSLEPLEAILLKNSPYFVAIQRIWM